MGRLEGKVALITGAGNGMGAAEARLFASEGANVVIADILDAEGRKVEADIKEMGFSAKYVHLDVRNEDEWNDAIRETINTFEKLDILVNNAGILLRHIVEETSEEEWDLVQSVNSTGVFLGTKAAIPEMRKNGGGSIVNISSISGLVGSTATAYSASKGAVRLLTKSTAIQYGPENIRCNSVHPGIIDTDLIKDEIINDPVERAKRLEQTPLNMIADADDVAYGVLYLASDEARYVTGSELVIDGGITAQ